MCGLDRTITDFNVSLYNSYKSNIVTPITPPLNLQKVAIIINLADTLAFRNKLQFLIYEIDFVGSSPKFYPQPSKSDNSKPMDKMFESSFLR